jgi:hypothetical protein
LDILVSATFSWPPWLHGSATPGSERGWWN